MSGDATLALRVARTRDLTATTRALVLQGLDGQALPAFDAGAHIDVDVTLPDGRPGRRAYSLVDLPGTGTSYEIAVQREEAGSGGSRWMHGLGPGDVIAARPPRNSFPLAGDASHHVLVAGGIGITPMLCMARQLKAEGGSFELHYAARTPQAMAYRDEVAGYTEATLWCDGGDPRNGLDLPALLARPRAGAHVYVCGPKGLIQAVLDEAAARGWAQDAVHHELFTGSVDRDGDRPFEVTLASSGRTYTVPVGRSIVDVLVEAGADPLFDCRRGECGVCVATVLDGVPDHRDGSLTDQEKAGGRLICPCVSRAATPHLVLDL